MNKFVGKIGVAEVLIWIFLILVLFFTVTPIVFMVTSSFMDARQILAMPYRWIPSSEYFSSADRNIPASQQSWRWDTEISRMLPQ